LREEAATVVGGRLSHLLIENYDNRESLAKIAKRNPGARVAIFHGVNDGVVPFEEIIDWMNRGSTTIDSVAV
jgi:hypothetical protein